MFTGNTGIAAIVDVRIVKAKQAWQVLQGKLISFGWRDRSTRISLFEEYVKSVLLHGCSVWGVTKLDGRGRVRVDCTGELGKFNQLCLRSILNVGHTTRNSILYMIAGKPSLSVYRTKAITQFVESWSKGNWLAAKIARHTLQLDSIQGPNQLTVVTMELTAEIFADRVQLYRNVCHWV